MVLSNINYFTKRNLFLILLILILNIQIILANDIQSFNTEIDVYNDGVAKVVNKLVLDTSDTNQLLLIPVYSPESIIVTDGDGELKFAVVETNVLIKPRKNIENYEIKLQYLTNALTSKVEDSWSLKYEIPGYSLLKYNHIKEDGIFTHKISSRRSYVI